MKTNFSDNFQVVALITKYIQSNSNFNEQETTNIMNKLLTNDNNEIVNYDFNLNPLDKNMKAFQDSLYHFHSLNDINLIEAINYYKTNKKFNEFEKNIKTCSSLEPFDFKHKSAFLKKLNKKSYQHMKTILGHLSLQDDMLGPIPIYCVSSIEKLDMLVTGDSNG
jgi:hypothetical protein